MHYHFVGDIHLMENITYKYNKISSCGKNCYNTHTCKLNPTKMKYVNTDCFYVCHKVTISSNENITYDIHVLFLVVFRLRVCLSVCLSASLSDQYQKNSFMFFGFFFHFQ